MSATLWKRVPVPGLVLTLGITLSVAPGPASAAAELFAGRTVTLFQPYGPESPAAEAIELLLPALQHTLGADVVVEQPTGPGSAAGGGAVEHVAQAAPDGTALVVVELLSRKLYEVQHPAAFALASLTPIAKLTLGLSSALFVAQDSSIRSWQDFVTAAKERPLMISHGWCLGMALMEAHLGVSLKAHMMMGAMMMEDRASIVEAVESGEADAGLFITRSLLPRPGTAPLPIRILGTFGAERHPLLPETATFSEVAGDPKADFTSAIAVFGPPGLPAETAAALTEAFLRAGEDGTVLAAAEQQDFPLRVLEPEVVRGTMERDAGTVRRVAPFLKAM
jgi:tripartite-type tricarboxylate transporter receptor subunit TctC